jgi:hypothetical protein
MDELSMRGQLPCKEADMSDTVFVFDLLMCSRWWKVQLTGPSLPEAHFRGYFELFQEVIWCECMWWWCLGASRQCGLGSGLRHCVCGVELEERSEFGS